MKGNPGRILIYGVLIGTMVFAGSQLCNSSAEPTEASCCTYGQDCKTKSAPRCCIPLNEADCSEAQKNYCKQWCI